jgi:hypothetical protein
MIELNDIQMNKNFFKVIVYGNNGDSGEFNKHDGWRYSILPYAIILSRQIDDLGSTKIFPLVSIFRIDIID